MKCEETAARVCGIEGMGAKAGDRRLTVYLPAGTARENSPFALICDTWVVRPSAETSDRKAWPPPTPPLASSERRGMGTIMPETETASDEERSMRFSEVTC